MIHYRINAEIPQAKLEFEKCQEAIGKSQAHTTQWTRAIPSLRDLRVCPEGEQGGRELTGVAGRARGCSRTRDFTER